MYPRSQSHLSVVTKLLTRPNFLVQRNTECQLVDCSNSSQDQRIRPFPSHIDHVMTATLEICAAQVFFRFDAIVFILMAYGLPFQSRAVVMAEHCKGDRQTDECKMRRNPWVV